MNEIGSRLGYSVTNSLYRDTNTPDLEAIVGYWEELIVAGEIGRKNSSWVGKGTFPSLIRGSDYSPNIRIISKGAVLWLLGIYGGNPAQVI